MRLAHNMLAVTETQLMVGVAQQYKVQLASHSMALVRMGEMRKEKP